MGTGLGLISVTTIIVVMIGAWTYWFMQTRKCTKRIRHASKNLANDAKCHSVLYLSMQPSRDNKKIKVRSSQLLDHKKQSPNHVVNHNRGFKQKDEKVIILKERRKEKSKALNKKVKSLPKVIGTGEIRKINVSSKQWWI